MFPNITMINSTQRSQEQKTRRAPPALSPESPGLVQPWKEFVQKGYISNLEVKFTPMGISMEATLGSPVTQKVTGAPTGPLAIGMAKQFIIDAGLWSPRGGKTGASTGPELPKRTLVKSDLEGKNRENLAQRAKAVALALGDTTARGRIGSLSYMRDGHDTFEKWWKVAPPKCKARLVMDDKHWKDLSDEDYSAIAKALDPCPFRGTVPTPKEEEHEAEEA
jgi:hypothetical protein